MNEQPANEEDRASSDELRAERDETRERVKQDVQALGNKLSPENLKNEAKQAVSRGLNEGREVLREKLQEGGARLRRSVETTERGVIGFIRENPVPLSLIGIGVGLLLYNAKRRARDGRQPDPAIVGRSAVYEGFDETEPESSLRSAPRSLRDLRERARGGVASAKHAATDTARQTRKRLGELEQEVAQRAQRVKSAAEHSFEEQPFVLGAVALGAGLAIGLGIPATESENQLVGRYRDRVFGSLKQQARKLEGAAEQALKEE